MNNKKESTIHFRDGVYQSVTKRADATCNLIDVVTGAIVVEYCERTIDVSICPRGGQDV